MDHKRLKDLPLPRLYEGLDIPEADCEVLHQKTLPDFCRVSLKSLSSLYACDIGDFAHKHRRVLVLDRQTIIKLREKHYEKTYSPEGYVYCYTTEDHLIAGHASEESQEGFLFWKKTIVQHEFKPKIKIGMSIRDPLKRISEQIIGGDSATGRRTGHAEYPIVLFLMYSPNAEKLEKKVQTKLKQLRYSLRMAEEPSPGMEWFKCGVHEAYEWATKYQKEIFAKNVAEVH